ncbi:MAG: glycosyltransferase family 2 protein [Dermatophilaceae bacterium]
MSVHAVTVTYDSGGHLPAFLDSVPAASVEPIAVTVVDNGSHDGAPQRAAERAGVSLTVNEANLGYGAAANVGARGGDEPWILVANPDIVLTPGSVDALLQTADRWPRAGALGPVIHTPDGMLYPSSRQIPSIGRGIGHAVFGWIWPANPWTAAYRRERGDPVEGPTGWVSGSCLLVRREAFERVGGFDEGYFMYFEDLDLCERIAKAGWQVVYAPAAVVVHEGGHSTTSRRDAMARAHHRSAYRYLATRYPGPRHLPLRMVLGLGLWGRYHLSKLVTGISRGAIPTRRVTGR